jgi:hypothetical protein
MMATISISHEDIIDVEFETVPNGENPKSVPLATRETSSTLLKPVDQLSILRNEFADRRLTSQPDQLSPLFLFVTLVCAFIVFWVSGGHALLY